MAGVLVMIFGAVLSGYQTNGLRYGSCDFNSGSLCPGYVQDDNDHFNWTVHNGSTPSFYTGPVENSGFYAYIETSWPRLNREKARLLTPRLRRINGNCLQFRYHMYGLNVRSLNVYAQEQSGAETMLWSLTGDKGKLWSAASVPLLIPDKKVLRVVFEGVVGTGYMGDVAIDDIIFSKKEDCSLLPINALPGDPKPPQPVKPLNVPFCGRKPGTRIVGGTVANEGDWPWQVSLRSRTKTGYWEHFCGGSLVTPVWVVTASHCINSIRQAYYKHLIVRVGGHKRNLTLPDGTMKLGNEQNIEIERIYIHPEYNSLPTEENYDIALIRLKRPAMLNRFVGLVCLPNGKVNFPPGTDCWISGWGTLKPLGSSPDYLMQAKVPLVSNEECTKNGSYPKKKITPVMLCAGKKEGGVDSCQGDSGGPLVCEANDRWYLVGVTSWGESCAKPNYPGVYGRVDHVEMKEWLLRVIGQPGA